MNDRKILAEGYDGSKVELKLARLYPLTHWKDGKCWSAWCQNALYFIKLNKKGEAMLGYCYHYHNQLLKLHKGQRWVHIEKGKLVVDL